MLCFRVIMLWREGSQYLFFIRQILCQKCLCQTVASGGVKHFHIVMHSYAASFSIKQVFVRLATFSSSKKTKKGKKMHDFESTSKIKVRSCWTFFKILLMSAVICISKVFHGNKLKLTEPIIEISLKVLLVKLLFVTLIKMWL